MSEKPRTEPDALQPLGRRARKALAVRQALFEAGLAAFERQPLGLVSVLDITEAADVAKGVFYLQFRSKDDYLLALWTEVKDRFLESLRSATIDCRSLPARIDAAVEAVLSFSREAPASARFWLRMSSYFPDEIGEPGHLTRIRQEYIQQLAVVIGRRTAAKLTARDLQAALGFDAMGWAAVHAELHRGEPLLGPEELQRAVKAVLPGPR